MHRSKLDNTFLLLQDHLNKLVKLRVNEQVYYGILTIVSYVNHNDNVQVSIASNSTVTNYDHIYASPVYFDKNTFNMLVDGLDYVFVVELIQN